MRHVVALLVGLLVATAALAQAPRATLGIGMVDVPPNAMGIHGAWVMQVQPGSPAATAGLQPRDVIVAVDGHPVPVAAFLGAYVAGRQPGDTIRLHVLRRNPVNPMAIDQLDLAATFAPAAAPPLAATPKPAPEPAAAPPPATPTAETATAETSAAEAPAADGAASSAGSVTWEQWNDPTEQAFRTEVPRGWRVMGGIFRQSPIAASPWLRLLSPDRQSYIVVGDPSIAYFATPLPNGANPPPRQGQVVRPFQTGAEFSRDYVMRILPGVCAEPAVKEAKPRPDLETGPWAQANPRAQHSGGQVTFTCKLAGANAGGLVAADTYVYRFPGPVSSLWTVDLMAGFVARPERIKDTAGEMIHVVSAFRMNQDWVRRQQAVIDATTRAINANTAAMAQWSQQQIAHAQAQMHAMSQQSEAFDRILTGNSPYHDGAGNIYTLDNTKTQWIGPGGRTMGTNGASPGAGWSRLTEVPPE